MDDAARQEREDAFRADAARVVQALRHQLASHDVAPEINTVVGPVQRLASLLDADAPTDHLQDAALAVVDAYDWPRADALSGEGPVIDATILATIERLRDAMDAIDAADAADADTAAAADADTAAAAGADTAAAAGADAAAAAGADTADAAGADTADAVAGPNT